MGDGSMTHPTDFGKAPPVGGAFFALLLQTVLQGNPELLEADFCETYATRSTE